MKLEDVTVTYFNLPTRRGICDNEEVLGCAGSPFLLLVDWPFKGWPLPTPPRDARGVTQCRCSNLEGRSMRRSNRDFEDCKIRSEVTLRFKGGNVKAGEWSGIFGELLPRPARYRGYFKNGQGNERQLAFDDAGAAIEYAVSVRREAQAAIKPYQGLEICIAVDVGEIIGA